MKWDSVQQETLPRPEKLGLWPEARPGQEFANKYLVVKPGLLGVSRFKPGQSARIHLLWTQQELVGKTWRTVGWPQGGSCKFFNDSGEKRALSQAVLGLDGELLTQTWDIVALKRNKDLLHSVTMSTIEKAKSEDSRECKSISVTEVVEVVNMLIIRGVLRVNSICPTMLPTLDIVKLSLLICHFSVTWKT